MGAFGFSFSRSVCRGGSVALAAGGTMMRRWGTELMSVLRPRPTSDRSGFVEHEVGLTVHMRNILDNIDTSTDAVRIDEFGHRNSQGAGGASG
jgi:hypothetical protein